MKQKCHESYWTTCSLKNPICLAKVMISLSSKPNLIGILAWNLKIKHEGILASQYTSVPSEKRFSAGNSKLDLCDEKLK